MKSTQRQVHIKNLKTPFLLIICLLLLLTSCKRSNDDLSGILPSSDPNNFEVSFHIYEPFFNNFRVESDTIVRFEALFRFDQPFTEYRWKVGLEEFDTRDVYLRFGLEDMDAPIPVTLYAKRAYNTPNGRIVKSDSATRYLSLKVLDKSREAGFLSPEKVISSPCIGSFSGIFTDNPTDTFPITIIDHGDNPSPSGGQKAWDARIYNLPKACGGIISAGVCLQPTLSDIMNQTFAPRIDQGFLGFTSNGSGVPNFCCSLVKANGQIKTNNRDSINIECEFLEGNGPVRKRTFIGKRI